MTCQQDLIFRLDSEDKPEMGVMSGTLRQRLTSNVERADKLESGVRSEIIAQLLTSKVERADMLDSGDRSRMLLSGSDALLPLRSTMVRFSIRTRSERATAPPSGDLSALRACLLLTSRKALQDRHRPRRSVILERTGNKVSGR